MYTRVVGLMARRAVFYRVLCLGCLMLAASAWAAPPAETLLATFASVLQRVATIRQLPLLKPIARAVRTRQQIRDSVAVLIREEMSPQEWEAERQAMIQWGLIPADFQLQAFVLDLLTEQAAGYYDPKQQQFFIADWLPEAVQEPVIAHELVHALQDQYYHLQANFDLVKDQSDLTLARKALVEGDAVAVMFVYMLEPLGLKLDQLPDMQALIQTGAALMGDQFQVYTKAPLILRQQLIFPYAQGLTFVKAALAQGGWATLAQVYAQPPLSTEQILHPEKYFTATPELPSTVNLHIAQEALAGPWTMVKRDVLGEFLLSVILQQFLPEDEARRSAAGWRGDRYELWQRQDDSRSLLVCVTDWDTPAEATEFLHSYQKLLAVKYPVWTLNADVDHSSYLWQHDDGRLLLRQHGQMVHLVEGATAADLPYLQTLLDQVTAVPLAQR